MDKLEEILIFRRRRIAEDKSRMGLADMERLAKVAPPRANFFDAINQPRQVAVIAEMKRRSPSAGDIRADFNAAAIAKAYQSGGASALSVLTEPDFFGGSIDDLKNAHSASDLPILRKDFIFDPYQIFEAKVAGASAILLIADMLPAKQLKELSTIAFGVNLHCLVEVFAPESLSSALETESRIIGINTRNLRTLEMNPGQVEALLKDIPNECLVVAESGLKGPLDMEKMKALRVAAVLVGESFLKQKDLFSAVKNMAKAGER